MPASSRSARAAQFRPVRLEGSAVAGAAQWLGDYRRFWAESLDRLDTFVKELKRKEDVVSANASSGEAIADREVVIHPHLRRAARLLFEAVEQAGASHEVVRPGRLAADTVRGRLPQGWAFSLRHDGPSGEQNQPFGGDISKSCRTGRSSSTTLRSARF